MNPLPLRRSAWLGLLACLSVMAQSSHADETELLELIERQAARIEALEARLAALEANMTAQLPGPAPAVEPPAPASITFRGGPEFASSDGTYRAKLRGRVLAEAWTVESDIEGVRYPSGTEMRAMRLGVEGRIGPAVEYRGEVDFAGDRTVIKEAWLRLPVGRAELTLGNQKPPFSLENLTGLPRTTFMERAAPNLFAFSETLGVTLGTAGTRWSLRGGLFGETPGVTLDGDEGYGAAARVTWVPVATEEGYLHLGLGGYHKRLGREAGRGFRWRQRPDVRIFNTRLVDTGAIDAASTSALGVELAAGLGAWSLQAELIGNTTDYYTLGRADFAGGYLFGSWVLTGERRPYTVASGTHGRLRPAQPIDAGGWGAFELALRHAWLDLDDGLVEGGRQDTWTLGLNWYPTAFSRLTANWVWFDVRDAQTVRPLGSPRHRGHALGVRAQVDW